MFQQAPIELDRLVEMASRPTVQRLTDDQIRLMIESSEANYLRASFMHAFTRDHLKPEARRRQLA